MPHGGWVRRGVATATLRSISNLVRVTVVDSERRPAYPTAERLDLVKELHGRRVADPYRWLEDPGDPRTVAWSHAQDGRCGRGAP